MNALLINWRTPEGDLVVTIGLLFEQDVESITLCSDLSEDKAYRGITIQRSMILDVTEVAPLMERRDVVLN
jgi:hypothetical protein